MSVYYNTENPIGTDKYFFENYSTSTLYVPESAIEIFKVTPCWSYFKNINGYHFNGVEEISADFDSTLPYDIFRISGEYVGNNTEGLTPGIYILRQGKTVKKITVM